MKATGWRFVGLREWTFVEWMIALAVAGILAAIALGSWYEHENPCVRSHVEHDRLLYLQHIDTGGGVTVSIPVYGDETVCDERARRQP